MQPSQPEKPGTERLVPYYFSSMANVAMARFLHAPAQFEINATA
jgi:hypothetical protein